MTDEDLRKIGQLIDEKLDQKLDEKLGALEQRFDEKLEAAVVRIHIDIGQFMEDILIPMINQKADKSDIIRLERKFMFG